MPPTRRVAGKSPGPRSASPPARSPAGRRTRAAKVVSPDPERNPASPVAKSTPKSSKPAGKAAVEVGLWHESAGGAPKARGSSALHRFFSRFVQVALILTTPNVAMMTVHTIVHKKGVISDSFAEFFAEGGLYPGRNYLLRITPQTSDRAYQLLACYAVFQALLLMFMPGKTFHGPITAAGNRPVYKANGVQCVVATAVAYAALYSYGLLDPVEVYRLFPEMIAGMSRVSLLFCTLLLVKGHVAPSSTDSGSGGSIVGDFYWGMELYPRFFGGRLDVKTFTNCRFGMMGWGVLCVVFAQANAALHGGLADSMAVCTALMLVYIFKFFVWETGYWGSMDIMHDRAGYMICWGCLVFVPSIYTSPALYLVDHAPVLGLPAAAAMLLAGLAAIYINYDSDVQRQVVRAANGDAQVWGKPAVVIRAQYVTAGGERKSSLLLASGWWGVARHFHYVPEISAAFLWSLPCGFSAFLPYFYVCFLTILLADRALRDDTRCRSKYGAAWEQYCKRVPYKMLPYVY